METEYKQKNELPDLYNILGLTSTVCEDKKCDEIIKKAYVKRAKRLHPDKHPGRKDIVEIFELLTNAYDILRDEKLRTAYNHKLSLDKQSSASFSNLKDTSKNYMDAIGEYKPPGDEQKLKFGEQNRL